MDQPKKSRGISRRDPPARISNASLSAPESFRRNERMSWKQIFARKSLDTLLAEMAGEHRLKRVLGPISLTALGVGAIVGSGIFVMTGRAAMQDAGPAIIISYCVAALGCALAAFCYAE